MKETIFTSLKDLLSDRSLLMLCVSIIIFSIIYIGYVSLSLSPTELQIATRFSAFSDAQFYRNKWYYLLGFIGFGSLIAFLHVGLIAKLRSRGMRPVAVGFGVLTLLLLLVAFLWTYSVLDIAYLS
jgi:hypothetical protein